MRARVIAVLVALPLATACVPMRWSHPVASEADARLAIHRCQGESAGPARAHAGPPRIWYETVWETVRTRKGEIRRYPRTERRIDDSVFEHMLRDFSIGCMTAQGFRREEIANPSWETRRDYFFDRLLWRCEYC